MHEYIGAAHIHSTYSDGTGSIPDIARAAAEVGLDFLLLTDHNSLKAKHDGWERWQDGVLLCIGYEINDRDDRNHYLAFGLDETVGADLDAADYVRRVRERGGVGFIAHPDERRNRRPEHPAYPWTAWECGDFDGLEIWNHMSEWMEGLTEENKFQRFIHPLKSILAPPEETLRRWDALNRTRLVTAIGGVDAHAHRADILGFFDVEVFPYKVMFKSIHTHVLLDAPLRPGESDASEAARRILAALRDGRSYVANSYHADPRGFRFAARQDGAEHQMGSTLRFAAGAIEVTALAPERTALALIHDGARILSVDGSELTYRVAAPGVYRVEAWMDGKGWIFSNPIRIVQEQ
jgi:hypothetical protein